MTQIVLNIEDASLVPSLKQILGAIKGVMIIWLLFMILTVTSTFTWSREAISQIQSNPPLKLLYDNNFLLDMVGDLTKVLFL